LEEWIVKCCFSDAVGEGMATAATFAVIPGGGAPAFRAGEETAETVVVGIFLAGEGGTMGKDGKGGSSGRFGRSGRSGNSGKSTG